MDEGKIPGESWQSVGFDDSTWKLGKGHFGYGDGDEDTLISSGDDPRSKLIVYYFRTTIELKPGEKLVKPKVRYFRDDGMVLYLKGRELFRDNLPEGELSYDERAITPMTRGEEKLFFERDIDPELFVEGTDVVAVEIRQDSTTSSDISFQLGLLVEDVRE